MSDQRSRYVIEVIGLDGLRAWSAEQANLEKRALAVERAMLQTAAASERYDAAAKQSQLVTARLNTELARTAEVAARTAQVDARLALEQERVAQGAQRLALAQARFNREGETSVSRFGAMRQAASALGNGLLNVSAGITGVGIASTMMAAKLERTFQTVRGNTTMTDRDFANMRATVLRLGADTGTSFEALAKGYEHISNYGFQAADATKILTEANKAARATGADTAQMAQTLAKVMAVYGLSADQAAATTAKLWYASANADARMQELATSGGQTFAMAKALGLSFDQAAATLSVFAAKGLNLREAVTQLRGDLSKMVNPTAEVRKEIEYLSHATGVELVKDFGMTGGHVATLSKIFDDLRRVSELTGRPVAELAAKIFPNLRGTIGALIGSSDSGIKGLHDRLKDLADPTKLIAELTKRETSEQAQLDTQIQKLQRTIEAEFLPIGTKFAGLLKEAMPVIKGVAEDVASLMGWFLKLPKPVQESVMWMGAFKLATVALGNPLTAVTGSLSWLIRLFQGLPAAAAGAVPALEAVATAERDVAAAGAGGAGGAAGGAGLLARLGGAGGGGALLGRAAAAGPYVAAGAALVGVGYLATREMQTQNQGGPTYRDRLQHLLTERDNPAALGGSARFDRSAIQHDIDYLQGYEQRLPTWGPSRIAQLQQQLGGLGNVRSNHALRQPIEERISEIQRDLDAYAKSHPIYGPPSSMASTHAERAAWNAAHAKPNPTGGATNPLPDNWADLATQRPKKGRGGSGEDPDITRDRITEANKRRDGLIYALTHTDWETQRHDARQDAADALANHEDPKRVSTWLNLQIQKIGTDQINAATTSPLDNVLTNVDEGWGPSALDDYNDYWQKQAEKRQKAQQDYYRHFEEMSGRSLSDLSTSNSLSLRDISARTTGDGDTDRLSGLLAQRNQQQGYVNGLAGQLMLGATDPFGRMDSRLPEALDAA